MKRCWPGLCGFAAAMLLLASLDTARGEDAPHASQPATPANQESGQAARSPAADFELVLKSELLTQSSPWIGVEVAPAGEALRVQLGLPAEQGAVVVNVTDNSPAADAGIQLHDVLLLAGDQPVRDAETLQAQVRAAGEQRLALRLIRAGKRLSLEVIPKQQTAQLAFTVDGQPAEQNARFWLGVGLATADDTLRNQLGLAAGEGLVVTSVEPQSPAEQAGVHIHDVLLALDGKPLTAVEGLQAQLQETGAKTIPLRLLRGGKPLALDVTPEKHQDLTWTTVLPMQNAALQAIEFLSPGVVVQGGAADGLLKDIGAGQYLIWSADLNAAQDPLQKQVADLMAQVQQMQKMLSDLDAALKARGQAQQPAEPPSPKSP